MNLENSFVELCSVKTLHKSIKHLNFMESYSRNDSDAMRCEKVMPM